MFENEPVSDFSLATTREALSKALLALDSKITNTPLCAHPLGEGVSIPSESIFVRTDPNSAKIVLSRTNFAQASEVPGVVERAHQGYLRWRDVPVDERASCIERAADELRRRRFELCALIIREAGKPWKEADGDVGEAIDFCVFYAKVMRELGTPFIPQRIAGETNVYLYEPRGVAAVIAPWNFPLAIACGMTVAALLSGNSAILKPAEQTSVIAYELVKILYNAGIPKDVLYFLPGFGEEVGRVLVEHPLTALIVFTGSRSVGLEILKACGTVRAGQLQIKRPILELGGKNAIIVDSDADLDEAIKGVIYSAFGYSGQKCSACSRVLVVGSAYSNFMQRLTTAAKDLIVGPSTESSTLVGPVIDHESADRIKMLIDRAKQSSELAFSGPTPTDGNFVPVSIFQDVPLSAELWREEVFGPVLATHGFASFDQALSAAIDSDYALTGGVYSRSPGNLEKAKQKFRVGNLYLNRSCTGSLVCRQPFGGFKMSGLGSKAGGPDYLLHFMDPRTITENTMRRGFTPETR